MQLPPAIFRSRVLNLTTTGHHRWQQEVYSRLTDPLVRNMQAVSDNVLIDVYYRTELLLAPQKHAPPSSFEQSSAFSCKRIYQRCGEANFGFGRDLMKR